MSEEEEANDVAQTSAGDRHWVVIGKVLAAACTVVTIAVGATQLWQSASGPSVEAIYFVDDYSPHPEWEAALKGRVSLDGVKGLLKGKPDQSAEEILESARTRVDVQDQLNKLDQLGTRLLHGKIMSARIINNGDSVVERLRLIIPGEGYALLSDTQGFTAIDTDAMKWQDEIDLGTLPPRAHIRALLWPKSGRVSWGESIAIVYEGGSRSARQAHYFYGWDAELVWWFLQQPFLFRYGSAAALLISLALLIRWLARKGHIVWRPKRVRKERLADKGPPLVR